MEPAWSYAAAAVLAALIVTPPPPSRAQLPAAARVLVLAPALDDTRVELVRDAVAFWNSAFQELGLLPALAEPVVVVSSPATRALENYARKVSRAAGRPAAGPLEPDPPVELAALEAEVVVLLSAQRLMPFAWPLPRTRRFFVAVDSDPSATAHGLRRVVAHEIGHTLGLRHLRGDPDAVMCMPCSRSRAGDAAEEHPRLSDRERSQLLELYSAAPALPGGGANVTGARSCAVDQSC